MKTSGLLNVTSEYRKIKKFIFSYLPSGKEKQSHLFVRSKTYGRIVLMNQTNLAADLMVIYLVKNLVLKF